MKTGIITFHAAMNYGSALQAFALQEYLRSRGHDAEIIDYRNRAQRQLYPSALSFNSIYNAKRTVRRMLSGWDEIRFIRAKGAAFSRFRSGYLKLSSACFTDESMLRKYDWSGFDLLVSGSDQIWNPAAIDFTSAYFLDFVQAGKHGLKKAAYATSSGPLLFSGASGKALWPEDSRIEVKRLLSDYNAVSVREKATLEMLENSAMIPERLKGNIPVMPDPVLLHDAAFYRDRFCREAGSGQGGEPYILFYCPGKKNLQAEHLADAVSAGMMGKSSAGILPESKRLRIIRVTDGAAAGQDYTFRRQGNDIMLPCGPDGFVNLVDHALCTVGTSFHLMAFSMLLGKDFYCPDASSDSRKIQLLEAAGLDPASSFFRFSDPAVQSCVAGSLAGLRKDAGTFWTRLGV